MGETTIRHLIEQYALVNEKYKQTEGEKDMLSSILVDYAKEK
jgi:hypothetical protein